MKEILDAIERIGFPAVMCVFLCYLLFQQKKSIKRLTVGINQLIDCIETFKSLLLEQFKVTLRNEVKTGITEGLEEFKTIIRDELKKK